jgi:hypothetical protein
LYLCGMVRQSDQEGALLLSNVSRPGNRRIRAPNQPRTAKGETQHQSGLNSDVGVAC